MKTSKDLFMEERESELYEVETSKLNVYDQLSDTFLKQADKYDNGDIDALETAILMRKDYERLEIQMNMRKAWLKENLDQVINESEKYGKEGYKGFIFAKQQGKLSYKHIPEWIDLDKKVKDFEEKSKLALKLFEKGGLNVDESGEEIPLPIYGESFLRVNKVK